jgi:HAD superfamily hydrolase (TIGR01509 family)
VTAAIKAVFWDNDGVLVETEHLYFEANRRVLESAGVVLTEDQYIALFLVQGRGAWHLLEERGVAAEDIDRLRNQRNDLYTALIREAPRAVPGVEEVLKSLHGKYTMGVVTSSRKDHFQAIHESTGLLKYFDFVLAIGDYARSKPEPDPYLGAIERSGAAPDECIAIEDSERGLIAATRAGLRCLVVPSALTRRQAFPGAYRVLSGVSEIPNVLNAG